MSAWTVAIVVGVIVLGLWLALEVASRVARLVLWALVLGALYWFAAPHLGLPMPWR